MNPSRRILMAGLAAGLATPLARAQEYPARPVRVVVPFAAGGPADIYARFIGQRLSETLGQTFIIENKPGAGAVIGTLEVARAAPDGHTLLLMSNTHTVNETLIPNRGYQLLRDFSPVAPINYSDLVLVVHPSLQVTTLPELIRLARARPRALNYASSGPGTPYHMAGELFKSMAGLDITHVPYKGSAGARTDVMAGHVQMMFDAVTTMAPSARAGKVIALATTGRARSSVMPEVPTVGEAGVPGYEAVIWLGLLAPAGTPAAIVSKLNAELSRLAGRTEVRQDWARQGAVPMMMPVDEFTRYLRADIDKWAEIVRISGAKAGD